MECDICMRPVSAQLPFHCVTCARSALYEPRIRHTKTILEKDQLASKIERVAPLRLEGKDGLVAGNPTQDEEEAKRRWSIESNNVRKAQAKHRTNNLRQHMQALRDEIKVARDEIATRKAILRKKRAERDAIKTVIPDRRNVISSNMKDETKKSIQVWDAVHNRAVETRSFLCREAAHLYGLKQRKKIRGGVVREQYSIGGIPVIDLADINSAKANELTTSLTNVARLVVLVSFYMSVRLPAQITLPHRNYPLPTIFTPANSYQAREIPFLGTTPVSSSTASPITSRHADHRPLPRPWPLFIEPENITHKMPNVAKRDPKGFSFFLEGVSLLAWDVAWLCRSQGLYDGTESWEDVCNIGRNLWNLLIAPLQPPALLRVRSGRDVRQQRSGSQNRTSSVPNRPLRLGQFSHDSAHVFSENGTDFLRGWKLTKYTMIVDPLKRALVGEMSNAEWEVLEQEEWDDGGEQFRDDQAVFIKNRNSTEMEGRSTFDDLRSIMTARAERKNDDRIEGAVATKEVPKADADIEGSGRAKGTSGWTKLKNREK